MQTINTIINQLQPFMLGILVICIIVFSIIFIKDRAWVKLLSFIAFGVVVGVLIYWAPALFGESGTLTREAGNLAGL